MDDIPQTQERVAVVTGAAMGIGLAISKRLVKEGIVVVGVDVNHARLVEASSELNGRLVPLEGDISDWSTHLHAADAAQAEGRLAYWVNNAGIDAVGGAHEVTEASLVDALKVLQLGPMFGCAIAVRQMLANGGGSIVNVSSIQGVAAFPRYFAYQAAKAALTMVSKGIAADYGHLGIRCNALLPGLVDTPMTRATLVGTDDLEAALREESRLSPMERPGTPEEIANAAWFLLSSESSYVTGASLVVDGGATTRCLPHERIEIQR
ncbi:SDR family NAD(P)-dependent oxidoreductase [Aeromicrobium sp.]|uniref:SDR family NAD(P)-dependent oxidoreductase n=1 Tax=Aeromicrobium sp. TaxID=1871063 RepID=UPI002FC69AE4